MLGCGKIEPKAARMHPDDTSFITDEAALRALQTQVMAGRGLY